MLVNFQFYNNHYDFPKLCTITLPIRQYHPIDDIACVSIGRKHFMRCCVLLRHPVHILFFLNPIMLRAEQLHFQEIKEKSPEIEGV